MALIFNGRCLTRPISGVERHARMLLRSFLRSGIDMRVLVPADAPEDAVLLSGLNVERVGRLRGHAWEQFTLARAVGRDDLLFSPANTGPLGVRRQAIVVHDLAFLHHPEWFDPRFTKWYGFLVPRLVRRAKVVITVSESIRKELMATYALPPERVVVIPPHVDPAQFSAAEPVQAPPGFFLLVGHDDPRKDARAALDLLFRARPGAHAVVVGRERRPFIAVDRSPDGRITWLPNVTDAQLTWLYDHAQALLYPSLYEGFGMPVLEAAQRGCPVVARPLPVLLEQFGPAVHACPFTGSDDLSGVLDRISARGTGPDSRSPETQQVLDHFTERRTDAALNAVIAGLT
jgi:glycosyltransferase involved in cell wall biosynthesis